MYESTILNDDDWMEEGLYDDSIDNGVSIKCNNILYNGVTLIKDLQRKGWTTSPQRTLPISPKVYMHFQLPKTRQLPYN